MNKSTEDITSTKNFDYTSDSDRLAVDPWISTGKIERNAPNNFSILEFMKIIVTSAIRYTKNPSGASLQEILEYAEKKYHINMKFFNSCLDKVLKEGVENGLYEIITVNSFTTENGKKKKIFVEKRFRIKKSENIKDKQNLLLKDEVNFEAQGLSYDSMTEKINLEQNPETHFPTHGMIIMMIKNSIKNLKKCRGASFEDISNYMEERYKVNMQSLKPYVISIVKELVDNGVLEKKIGSAGEEKFMMKNAANIRKSTQNLLLDVEIDMKATNLKDATVLENANLKRKPSTNIPTREMVITMISNSINYLKNSNGASFEDISNYMEEKYRINMNVLKSYIKTVLKECIHKGLIEKISGETEIDDRFKIKE